MSRVRLVACVGIVVLMAGALPAAADTNDWGTWAFTGRWKSWSGTFFDAHYVQGVVIGTKSLPRNNGVTSFTLGKKQCKISTSLATGYCYNLHIPPNKKLRWTLTTRKPLTSSAQIGPCIEWNKKFHCRFGNG